MSEIPRPINGVKSEITNQIVEIVPAILMTDFGMATVREHFDSAFRELEQAGVYPLRIVHGEATAEPLDELVREEIRENAARAERAKIVTELTKLSYDYFTKNQFPSAAAFAIAADRVRNGKASS